MRKTPDPLDWYEFSTDMEALRHKINRIQSAWPHITYTYGGGYDFHELRVRSTGWPNYVLRNKGAFRIDVKEFIQYSDEEVMNAVELWLHIIDQWRERR